MKIVKTLALDEKELNLTERTNEQNIEMKYFP